MCGFEWNLKFLMLLLFPYSLLILFELFPEKNIQRIIQITLK